MKKRFISMAILLSLSFMLASCSGNSVLNDTSGNNTESVELSTESTDTQNTEVLDTDAKIDEFENSEVSDTEAPTFAFSSDFVKNPSLQWGAAFDAKAGITVTDNIDGDLTSRMLVGGVVDTKSYGTYTLTYAVIDSAGNRATLTRTVKVVWPEGLGFIGHGGCYYGGLNSEQAFIYAASVRQYQYIECDIRQTKDGVFVTCHDSTFGDYTIASTNWSTLKKAEKTVKRAASLPKTHGDSVGTYTHKICSLQRYLEICKQYGSIAVLELKSSSGISSSSQSRMSALMEEIKKAGMLNQVIFLSSMEECLIWVKNNGYSYIPCQYLLNSCESQEKLDFCVKNGFDISVNIDSTYSNSKEWIKKYQAKGLKVSCYTFSQYVDYPELQKWINKGVDFVTCDWHRMDKVTIPS